MKSHVCNICNKKYASYKSLWNHSKKFHSNTDLVNENNIDINNINNIDKNNDNINDIDKNNDNINDIDKNINIIEKIVINYIKLVVVNLFI